MTSENTPGALGHVQLLAFANATSLHAATDGANTLGLAHVHSEPGTILTATEYLKHHASPQLLLVEITSQEDAAAQLDALANVVHPLTKVLVCGAIDSVRFYHWLLDIGIHDYLLTPFTPAQFTEAVARTAAPKEPVDHHAATPHKLIAVMGTCGGAGTTTIAVNLAAYFAQTHSVPTAILDLDPYFGNTALSLDLEAGRGLRDALEKPDRIDSLFLERVMVRPFPHLSVLSAEEPLKETLHIHAHAGEMLCKSLAEKFPVIVADLPRQMTPVTRDILARADHTILVAQPQLSALRDTVRLKHYLTDILKRPAPITLLNRVGFAPRHELSVKEFAKYYGAEPSLQLPYLADAITAHAEGELLLTHKKVGPAFAPLWKLGETLYGKTHDTPAPKPVKEKRSLLQQLNLPPMKRA